MPSTKQIGEWLIRNLDEVRGITNGQTASRQSSSGSYHLYEVTGPVDVRLLLAFAVWQNGERDVRPLEAQGPQAFKRLDKGGLRLTVEPLTRGVHARPGRMISTLRQARIKADTPNQWSNLQNATLPQLNEAANVDVADTIGQLGAVVTDTKAEVLGEKGPTRAQICTVYEGNNRWIPVVAFVLTRAAPLLNAYGVPD